MAFAAFGFAFLSTAAVGQVKQIQLNERQIESFLAAHGEISVIAEKLQTATGGKPDPKIQAELEAAAIKYGFKGFRDYDDVLANISMIMAGFDPRTKAYTEPRASIEKEIDEVLKDKTIPEKVKMQTLEELNDALRNAQPLLFPGNVDLVKKHYHKIEKLLQ